MTVCPAWSPPYSVLVLRVTEPGPRQSVLVVIGLAGNGIVARTILHSLAFSGGPLTGDVFGFADACRGYGPPGNVFVQV
ncbi:MAG TPA: hypothetical protein VK217_00035, partial [Acidimicrobiales bacterium]|nr:hypothetical protein [Acidimicrobiales bacterium]